MCVTKAMIIMAGIIKIINGGEFLIYKFFYDEIFNMFEHQKEIYENRLNANTQHGWNVIGKCFSMFGGLSNCKICERPSTC
jgi:hypothetical protein